MNDKPAWVEGVFARLDKLESTLAQIASQRQIKGWYSTDEVAQLLGKAKFTVREWCRHGRVHCKKKNSGRGSHLAWVISHEEVERIQREGLLPMTTISSRIE